MSPDPVSAAAGAECCSHCAHDEPRVHETPCDDCAATREAERQRISEHIVSTWAHYEYVRKESLLAYLDTLSDRADRAAS